MPDSIIWGSTRAKERASSEVYGPLYDNRTYNEQDFSTYDTTPNKSSRTHGTSEDRIYEAQLNLLPFGPGNLVFALVRSVFQSNHKWIEGDIRDEVRLDEFYNFKRNIKLRTQCDNEHSMCSCLLVLKLKRESEFH